MPSGSELQVLLGNVAFRRSFAARSQLDIGVATRWFSACAVPSMGGKWVAAIGCCGA